MKLLAAFSLLLLLCVYHSSAYTKSYEGYELLEVLTKTVYDRDVLRLLVETDPQLDVWFESLSVSHLFVGPNSLQDVKNYFDVHNVHHSVINDHVQRDIEKEELALALAYERRQRAFDYNDFNTYEDIVTELFSMPERCQTDVQCVVANIGRSTEGRFMLEFRMWKNEPQRPAIWIDATIHAREWLATATHLKIMQHLIDDYDSDPEVKNLVDTYDFFLLPVLNPDGYNYTWSDDRLWRKNRRINAQNLTCPGVDLNRNFNEHWGNAGTSDDPCSNVYKGLTPASEEETQIIQMRALALRNRIMTSVHIHTYGQMWLIPWGSTINNGTECNYAEDDYDMMTVANAAADAIEDTHATNWTRGNSCATIYPASGLTMDFFKAMGAFNYTATPELRGDYFIVDSTEIQPSYEELWNGIVAAIHTIERMNR